MNWVRGFHSLWQEGFQTIWQERKPFDLTASGPSVYDRRAEAPRNLNIHLPGVSYRLIDSDSIGEATVLLCIVITCPNTEKLGEMGHPWHRSRSETPSRLRYECVPVQYETCGLSLMWTCLKAGANIPFEMIGMPSTASGPLHAVIPPGSQYAFLNKQLVERNTRFSLRPQGSASFGGATIGPFEIFSYETTTRRNDIRGQYVDFRVSPYKLEGEISLNNPNKARLPSQYFLALKVQKRLSETEKANNPDGIFPFSIRIQASGRYSFWSRQRLKHAVGDRRGDKTISIDRPVRQEVIDQSRDNPLGLVHAFRIWERAQFDGVEFAS
jgi:hypothetical protein